MPNVSRGQFGRRRKWGCVRILLSAVLLFLTACFVALLVFQNRLRQQEARLQMQGLPTSGAQLKAPQIPEADNGAMIYLAAASELPAPARKKDSETTLLDPCPEAGEAPEYGVSEAELQQLRDTVASQAAALARALEAQAKEVAYFGTANADPKKAIDTIEQVRALSRAMCDKALLAAIEGNKEEAYRWTIANLRLANDLRDGGTLTQFMGRVAVARTGLQALRQTLLRVGGPGEQGAALSNELHQLYDREALAETLRGELAYGLDAMRSQGINSYFLPMFRYDYTESLTALIDAAAESDDALRAAALAELSESSNSYMPWKIYSRLLVPAIERTIEQMDDLREEVAGAELSVAIAQHHDAHGAYPASLEEVSFSEEAATLLPGFHYELEGEGWRMREEKKTGMGSDLHTLRSHRQPEPSEWCQP